MSLLIIDLTRLLFPSWFFSVDGSPDEGFDFILFSLSPIYLCSMGMNLSIKEKGNYSTMISRWRIGTTSFCGRGSPLAAKRSTTPAPVSTRTPASPAESVSRSAPSRPSSKESPIVWTAPGVMNAAVVSRSAPRTPLSFHGPPESMYDNY